MAHHSFDLDFLKSSNFQQHTSAIPNLFKTDSMFSNFRLEDSLKRDCMNGNYINNNNLNDDDLLELAYHQDRHQGFEFSFLKTYQSAEDHGAAFNQGENSLEYYQQQQFQHQQQQQQNSHHNNNNNNNDQGFMDLQDFPAADQVFELDHFHYSEVSPKESTNSESGDQKQQPHINHNNNNQPIWQITRRVIQQTKIKKQNTDKNICRYIARQCIRCFVDKIYRSEVLKFCGNDSDLYEESRSFMLSQLELISGHRALAALLTITEDDEFATQKTIFKHFAKWFLKERSNRYILSGNMNNKKQYIRYKNEIMLKYIDKPNKWECNLKIKKKKAC